MPGLPAAGGWGGSGRTLGIKMEGFTDEEIAKAVDLCDNDRVRGKLFFLVILTSSIFALES